MSEIEPVKTWEQARCEAVAPVFERDRWLEESEDAALGDVANVLWAMGYASIETLVKDGCWEWKKA